MKKLKTVVVVALGLLIAVDVALGWFLTELENKPSANRPSHTMGESKARGAFVDVVVFEPSSFEMNGKRIVIREAWLEHQNELVHIHVIVPFLWEHRRYRQVGGYNLCFNLDDSFCPIGEVYFFEEGKGASFGMLGTVVLWYRLEDLDDVPARVLATTDWKFANSQVLSVKRGAQ